MKQPKVLITGSAGFIGMHTALKFSAAGFQVYGLDNLNTYYDVELKLSRLKKQGIDTSQIQYNTEIKDASGNVFAQLDITDFDNLKAYFEEHEFDYVIHLAAQAGVRYSIENPHAYTSCNVEGFLNILECSKIFSVKHLIYASSSSVYGMNQTFPFTETHQTETQVSLYAATKKANEAMAHSYASVYSMPVTGLRFFTVYGPYGRPDMALFKFTKKIFNGDPIDVYNHGKLSRDFTYVDDIVDGMYNLIAVLPEGKVPYEIYNIGNGQPVQLMDFISCLERELGKKADLNFLPMQPGDVEVTYADTTKLTKAIGYMPKTNIASGVYEFVKWYKGYYRKVTE